ncbi:MAG: hypothetical protein AAGF99_07220 [Bacteroidota bacterium]
MISTSLCAVMVLGVFACSPRLGDELAELEVVRLNEARGQFSSSGRFEMLADSVAVPDSAYIGQLSSLVTHSGRSTLDNLFAAIREQAGALNANAFRVSSDCAPPTACGFEIDLYAVPSDQLRRLSSGLPNDVVVLFGRLDGNNDPVRLKLNDEPVEIEPFSYVVHDNTGEGVTISIGGLLGASLALEETEGLGPRYFSFSSLGLSPSPPGRVGVGINTGRVYPVKSALAQFLLPYLRRQEF